MKLSLSNHYYLLCLSLVIICLATICLANDQGNDVASAASTGGLESARAKFTLPKMFDFERYKTIFKKHYPSLSEEVARAKLYLARAFRAFVSAVSYKHHRASSYLAINQMSDWTPEEARKIRQRRGSFSDMFNDAEDIDKDAESLKEDGVVPVASLDEVEHKLDEIVRDGEQQPDDIRRLIAQELIKRATETHRKRRSTTSTSSREQFSLDDIDRAPAGKAEDVGQRIESNNPLYEPPEQASFGSSSDAPTSELSARTGSLIASLPGGTFINWVLEKATNAFSTVEEDEGEDFVYYVDRVKVSNKKHASADKILIDHRDECMFEPRDQGTCGSCYAFAAISVFEWLYCKATGKKVAFSEQYMIDCGRKFGMDGCGGGYTYKMPTFVRRRGLELRSNYPYREREDQCPYNDETPDAVTGYLRVTMDKMRYVELPDFEKVLKKSPLLITILVGDKFQEYGGGVDDGSDCDPDGPHAVALVGSGREDNHEYWLIRNSFDTTFGEDGYYKLNKKATHCIELQQAYLFSGLRVKGADGINPMYHSDLVRQRLHEHLPKQN